MSIIKGMHFGMKEGDKFLRLDLKVIFSMAQSMFPLEISQVLTEKVCNSCSDNLQAPE